ncbi:NtaA/DmoA family FMN-dependent monooxygenase [Gordonia sp. ABSL1-1]|uniref:NtaA/DmoA family FMN-dependent monooxygenase n=1 Tax=Gordonia sp. ABSL1-1 TaxID=3053923 RepID=UPI00257355FC|nr:NtaA/DmoA family FMN-dependent monooxygenase [Gordonia sp. ABSL1-1]MDL9937799.1 NtaA/DmoA family FMN-dependent monooxygenase [Gordonia sp. ABSL1-1]
MPQLLLNAIIRPIGFTRGGWRHPSATPERALDLDYYQEIATVAERGRLDALFIANSPVAPNDQWTTLFSPLEPITLLSTLAATTTHLGLIATVSSTFTDPYQVARQLSTLDHLSKGRAGVNIVVSGSAAAAANFGFDDLPDQSDRYARADEYLHVLQRLWDSWPADALILDKAGARQADLGKLTAIEFRGKHLAVRGPLDIPRSPQGRPLVFQAGSSPEGRQLAAAHADAVYSAARTIDDALAFRADIHRRQDALGRTGSRVKVLPGLIPIVGSTDAEARRLHEEISALYPIGQAVEGLGARLGVDLVGIDADDHFPIDLLPPVQSLSGNRSFHEIVRKHAAAGATLREVLTVTDAGNAHLRFIGAPETIADQIQEWFRAGAADGFNLNPAISPSGLTDFVDHVLPVLQDRGIRQRDYPADTRVRPVFGSH